jgi:hypothetical protein
VIKAPVQDLRGVIVIKHVFSRRGFAAAVAGAAVAALAGVGAAVPASAAAPEPTMDFRSPTARTGSR